MKTKTLNQNTGIGNYQTEKAINAKWSILKTLSDGEWHRNMELKEKTRLSSRTLSKHLKQMTELKIIEKKEDIESGKYPVPVLYKTTPIITGHGIVLDVINERILLPREIIDEKLKLDLNQTKDPLIVLESIHESSEQHFLGLLSQIQHDKNITDKQINILLECFLWEPYKQYTSKLLEASRKIINDFNITDLIENQIKRLIENGETERKILEYWEHKTDEEKALARKQAESEIRKWRAT